MKLLIVDDEHLARDRLIDMLKDINASYELHEATNGAEAIETQSHIQADVILLDIRMPVMDGLEASMHLNKLDPSPMIVFTTAYGDHALDAFESNAIDYLLKPIKQERLKAALDKCVTMRQGRNFNDDIAQLSSQRTHLSAKTPLGLKIIPVHDILYFKADQKYVSGFYDGGELVLDETLKSLEKEFVSIFIRTHRNTLVSIEAIKSLDRDEEGNAIITLKQSNDMLPVSRRHLSTVKALMKS